MRERERERERESRCSVGFQVEFLYLRMLMVIRKNGLCGGVVVVLCVAVVCLFVF